MESEPFGQLLLISSLAFLVPLIIARLPGRSIPAVVGEIVAGVAIGTSGFDIIDPDVTLEFLAEFGFAYVMFLAGLELDARLILRTGESGARGFRARADSLLGLGTVIFAGTLTTAFIGVLVLETLGLVGDIWLSTLIFSTTSVSIVVPTLKAAGQSSGPYGQALLVAAFLADFVTLVLISIYAAIERGGTERIGELAFLLALPIAAIVLYRLSALASRSRFIRRTLEQFAHETSQIRVRASLALMLAFVVLAENIGFELILGSFLAGLIIALISPEEGSALRLKLDAIGYGFFIPIFFIDVGAGLDVGALSGSTSDLLLVPTFLLLALATKVVPSLFLLRRFSLRETLAGGFLLSSRLSLILAASIVGLELGIVSEAANAAIILLALITSSLGPIAFRMISASASSAEDDLVIVVGAGETGKALSSRLAAHGVTAVLLDADAAAVEKALAQGMEAIGEADIGEALRRAGATPSSTLVAATSNDAYNLYVCRRARNEFGIRQLTARVNHPERVREFVSEGIRAVPVTFSTSSALETAVLRPNFLQFFVDQAADYDVVDVVVRNRDLVGKQLREVVLPANVLVLLIRRDRQLIAPSGTDMLERGDFLTLAGDPEAVREAARMFRVRRLEPVAG